MSICAREIGHKKEEKVQAFFLFTWSCALRVAFVCHDSKKIVWYVFISGVYSVGIPVLKYQQMSWKYERSDKVW